MYAIFAAPVDLHISKLYYHPTRKVDLYPDDLCCSAGYLEEDGVLG